MALFVIFSTFGFMLPLYIRRILLICLLGILTGSIDVHACSIIYYVDPSSGKIYVANNEDYWYDTKAYIQVVTRSDEEYARLWYGWDKFAQGGVNEHGLFFDAAVTPEQEIPEGFTNPNGRNVGDEILAFCRNVEEAVKYLEKEKIAVSGGHMMLGDREGKAVVLEWVRGEIRIVRMQENYLIATNFLLSETDPEDIECPRYLSIEARAKQLNTSESEVDLRAVGNTISGAVQVAREDEADRTGGTLYSSFMNLTDMELVLVPRLDNTKVMRLDLEEEFAKGRKRKIKLQ